jgi:DNA-binding NtrC family response regulator
MASSNVVIVSPDRKAQQVLRSVLEECGVATISASTVKEAKSILHQDSISVVLSSDELPDGEIGDILRDGVGDRAPVVVFSRLADWKYYLKVVHEGAFDCVLYPPVRGEIERVVLNALKNTRDEKAKQKAAAG